MICFIINVHGEEISTVRSVIDGIKDFYSDADILVLHDGTSSFGLDSVTEFEFPHLKHPSYGGQWTHRYLTTYLRYSEKPCLIKIDPDTTVLGKIQNLPSHKCIFTRLLDMPDLRFIHGGAIGFTREMAQEIVDEKYMLEQRWVNNARCVNYHDTMLSIVAKDYNLPLLHRGDFACKSPIRSWSVFSHK